MRGSSESMARPAQAGRHAFEVAGACLSSGHIECKGLGNGHLRRRQQADRGHNAATPTQMEG